jgi:hypothetical protein
MEEDPSKVSRYAESLHESQRKSALAQWHSSIQKRAIRVSPEEPQHGRRVAVYNESE